MKIVYTVTLSEPMGGAQIYVRDVALSMAAEGHDVSVVVGRSGALDNQLNQKGIATHSLRSLVREVRPHTDLRCISDLMRLFRKMAPDLICANSSKAGILSRIAARRTGYPAVFVAHGWSFTEGVGKRKRAAYRFIEKTIARLGHPIIAVSDYDRDLAIRCGVCRPEQIATVHNGAPDVAADLVARPGQTPAKIVMVARFDEPKDQGMLVAALGGLRELPWRLQFVGEGPGLEACRQQVEQLDVADRVEFLGWRDDVVQLLAAADIFALCTNYEGLPLSIIEAMRAGLPVVASNVGGIPELVKHERTGLLLPKGNFDDTSAALAKLLRDPALRVRMGAEGRRAFEEAFSWERMLAGTIAVYERALKPSRPAA